MSIFPYMQFERHNPLDTALRAAMGTYTGLGQAKGQQITNQMNAAQLPYAQQNAMHDALLKQIEAKYAPKTAEQEYQLGQFDVQKAQAEAPYYEEIAGLKPEEIRNNMAYKRAMAQWAQVPPWQRAAYERELLNEQDAIKKINTELPTQTRESMVGLNALAGAEDAYNKMTFKGPVLGKGQELFGGVFKSNEAQILEKNVGTLQAALLRALQTGHINIQDYEFMSKRLPSALLGDEAFKTIEGSLQGVLQREAEEEQFKRFGLAQGYAPTQINTIWSAYNTSRPPLKNGKLNEDIIGSDWKDFYAPENASKVLQDPTYKVKTSKERYEELKAKGGG